MTAAGGWTGLAHACLAVLAGIGLVASAPAAAEKPRASGTLLVANTGMLDENASPTVVGDGDAQYRQLYAQWRALDRQGSGPAPLGRLPAIAVPSGMPLEGARFTSQFGMRSHPVLGGRRQHHGIDLAAPTGTPVYATADGTVSMAQFYGAYGNYIQIEHGGDMQTRYAHLSGKVVAPGERVTKGQLIGFVGSTGRSTGPHLHYEVRIAGQPVDPLPYMAQTDTQRQFALGNGQTPLAR
ncbi:M23 family metallopeptidase [Erythrobacteraceae bacterium CFH 75059]|uniref:M23 family metallopeptidase n=1 Tax=Qipengyuania thermophila TaxID=2509361 RepID=UPI0010225B4D|nr:M23 family metallopeptidase [Qipengyuania thermophila]TCD06568.1 M23 family metallopeptidase [Erythrobacteraceae bacterium CFH 75059]